MGLFLFISWSLICGYSLFSNRDIFSPVKLYLLTLGVYFSDLFTVEYFSEIYVTYIIYLLMGLLLAMLEAKYYKTNGVVAEREKVMEKSYLARITFLMWLLTLIPVTAQLYLISYMGGLEQYLTRIGFRTVEWRGMGHVTTAIRFINVITLCYFGIGLVANMKKPFKWWALFCLHFLLFMAMGLLSGSRGFLEIIITMLIMYHYLRRSITVKAAVSIGLLLFAFASVIGIARNGFKVDDGQIITGFSYGDSSRLKLRQGDYGIQPLDLVYSQDLKELQFGKTFLTVITNFVPRDLWPKKPDPGGLVLTKQFTDDAWDGASNLSTGMIAESILNFGYVGGVLIGSLLLFGSMLMTLKLYIKIKTGCSENDAVTNLLKVVVYIYVMKTMAGLVTMEFTNAIMLLLINISSFLIVYLLLKYRITIFHSRMKLKLGTAR